MHFAALQGKVGVLKILLATPRDHLADVEIRQDDFQDILPVDLGCTGFNLEWNLMIWFHTLPPSNTSKNHKIISIKHVFFMSYISCFFLGRVRG